MSEHTQQVRTLVDCDCRARVHHDGSGIEIDFCDLHQAAPAMLGTLREAYYLFAHGVGAIGASDKEKQEHNIQEGKRIIALIQGVIAQAEGRS